jgi:hypothetical protein
MLKGEGRQAAPAWRSLTQAHGGGARRIDYLVGELVSQDAAGRRRVLAGYGSSLHEPRSQYDEGPMTRPGCERRVRHGRLLTTGDDTG